MIFKMYRQQNSHKHKLWLLPIILLMVTPVIQAQQSLPYNTIELDDLSHFQDPPGNWVIAGDIYMDMVEHHHTETSPGSGILVNTSQGESPQDIFTNLEHGDLDLELEFMMAANSNSGIYFQGRYELQMLDSWGVQNPRFGDMGGVYQWWEDGAGTGGIAPRNNASRAPGLWQHLEVKFRAPRFDENGDKIQHARLKEVKLNGVVIHRNVHLVHPTGGAVSNEETEKAALRIQGDHGPVAFRNIRYKTYHNQPLKVANLTYQYKTGSFETAADVLDAAVQAEGSLDRVHLGMLRETGEIGVVYNGTVHIPESGDYYFDVRTDGGHLLMLGGTVISEANDSNRRYHRNAATVPLQQGEQSFELVYFRGARGGQPAVGIFAEGPDVELHNLHDAAALPTGTQNIPLLVEPSGRPYVMHGFMNMDERVRTNTAAVGYPEGVNFAFDQNGGALMKIWKGDFVNAATMWVGRGGNNLSLNEDAAITLGGAPSIAKINGREDAWPSTLREEANYRFQNYRFLDNGRIAFSYEIENTTVTDLIYPGDDGKLLRRTVTFENVPETTGQGLFVRVATGSQIERLPNNNYQVDDKTYYVKLNEGSARIRTVGERQELLIPVESAEETTIDYSLIW